MQAGKEMLTTLTITFAIGILLYGAMTSGGNKFMGLGDEVTTTDEYNILFNDTFSGRIVSIDSLYTVRDENGTERMFEWKWIDHVDVDEVI